MKYQLTLDFPFTNKLYGYDQYVMGALHRVTTAQRLSMDLIPERETVRSTSVDLESGQLTVVTDNGCLTTVRVYELDGSYTKTADTDYEPLDGLAKAA